MAKRQDITGKQFGRLKAIEVDSYSYYPSGGRYENWRCECSCGKSIVVRKKNLLNGNTASCGCSRIGNGKTHGGRQTKLYAVWCSMKDRCYNPNSKSYKNYGARGIYIAPEWMEDFSVFREWSLNNGYSVGLSLDRIDVNGPYAPYNCRWTDAYTQANNRRNSIHITLHDETHTIAEWARITGINYSTIINRYRAGMTPKDILSNQRFKSGPKPST